MIMHVVRNNTRGCRLTLIFSLNRNSVIIFTWQYSLSDAPGKDYYRISVKREDECEATPAGIVSNYMHYHVEEGDDVFLTVPAGDFYLDVTSSRPVLLIAGGVGLTPLMSMFNTLIEQYP